MKLTTLCVTLALAAAFIVGPKFALEARHHHSRVSVNMGPVISCAPAPVVVQQYPAYVQDRVYVDPYGYSYSERVYVEPAPRAYYVYPRPAFFSGFSLGFNFR